VAALDSLRGPGAVAAPRVEYRGFRSDDIISLIGAAAIIWVLLTLKSTNIPNRRTNRKRGVAT